MGKNLILIVSLFIVLANCSGQTLSKDNDPILHPYLVNHKQIKKMNNRDISFYLNSKSIDPYSKRFYKGEFAISDDEYTFSICDSVSTDNPITRPFYLYVFCRILELSDGAISEVMGEYCTEYMTKFPCEFIYNLNSTEYKLPLDKWLGFVAFNQDSKADTDVFTNQIDKRIKAECIDSYNTWTKIKGTIFSNFEE